MHTYRLAPPCVMLGSAILVSGMVGCGGGDGTGSYTVSDSAGVEIMMNSGPAWSEGEGWRVDPEPSLTIGTPAGDPAYELHGVRGAVRFLDGDLAVLNSGSQEVRIYDQDGQYLRAAAGEGEGPGRLQAPYLMFALADDTVVVSDGRQRRLSFFGRDGQFARSYNLSAENRYIAAALFGDGALLVTSGVTTLSDRRSGPIRPKDHLTVLSASGDSMSTLGAFASQEMYARYDGDAVGTATLVFGRTRVMAAHGSTLFVGTNDGFVIDQYRRDGTLVRSIRRDHVTPVTDDMFAAELEATSEQYTGPYGDFMRPILDEMPQPNTLPHYSAIKADPEGNLWVRDYHCRTMPSFEWTVFDPQGLMLGDVTLPERFDVYEIGRDYVLGRWRDDADVEYVRLHKVNR